MRIAQVAPPLESVPPLRYGGTERVVSTLTEELVRRGHDVTLFAAGGSRTSARFAPIIDEPVWHHRPPYQNFDPFFTLTVGRFLRSLDEFDVVHSHLDYIGFPMARMCDIPVVTTMHGRLDLPEMTPVLREFDEVPLVSISDAQRCPQPDANWVATIYHGIEVDTYTFQPNRGRYLAFLGRIAPEKGVDAAIRIADKAGMPIRIAARLPLPHKNNPEVRRDWEYYENEVLPLLQGPDVELIGQVAGKQKDDFLRNAAALLFPIRWPEPFGLVMPEAMACGTPVLALRAGSVPEIITDGVTGFIGQTEDDLVDAVGRLDSLDRAACRKEVERRFSPQTMADSYEQVYASLLAERVATEAPGVRNRV